MVAGRFSFYCSWSLVDCRQSTVNRKRLYMIIRNIEVSQFRNYGRCTTKLSPKINWIYGANGQGKTNLVEAVFYLCNLESFRTTKPSLLLQEKKLEAVLQAKVERKKVLHLVRVKITKKRSTGFFRSQTLPPGFWIYFFFHGTVFHSGRC